jgi:hypothetical protein
MPLANSGESSFYAHWFPGFGNTPYEVAKTILGNPGHTFTSISTDEHLTYYLKIFGPTGFLALLSPVTLIGFPQLVVNAISAHGYTHDFRFHYTSIVAASVFLGTTHAVAWFGQHRRALRRVLAILVLVIALVAHIAWSPSPIGAHYRTGTWAGPSERHGSLRTALQMIPDDAAVTATYYIVPHLTHRKQIFEFPNPFRLANWGINGERPGNPDDIDFLMIDEHVTGADSDLFRQLIGPEGPYSVVFSEKGLTLAKRKAT